MFTLVFCEFVAVNKASIKKNCCASHAVGDMIVNCSTLRKTPAILFTNKSNWCSCAFTKFYFAARAFFA